MRGKNYNAGLRGVLFEARHYARMGQAVWLYGWLVLRETRERGGIGFVLGGRPVSYREIEEETGFSRKSLERWMQILRRGGYIETTTAPAGIIVRIQKAKKFCREARNNAPETFPQPLRGSVDNLWISQPDAAPLLKFADSLPRSDAPHPQNCGVVRSDATESTRLAEGIGSGAIERQIEKQLEKQGRACSVHRENKLSHLELFTERNPRTEAKRLHIAARPASRSEDIARELRVGAGPQGRK
ncbi:MAG TPA: hypothetical protein VJN21_02330 [Candidatus Acidoferrales bacterium]|nr:hypothetical protein [Candidatus Acidoferrales bacterium]